MSVDFQAPFKLIPDAIFANSSFLRELQARGLYDQNGAANRAPLFQVFPAQAFATQGAWGTAFYESAVFQKRVAGKNAVELPYPIVAAIIAEQRSINLPYAPYLKFTTEFVQQVSSLSTSAANARLGTDFTTPDAAFSASDNQNSAWISTFYNKLCGYIVAMIDDLAPSLCSGEMPLSTIAPGFRPYGDMADAG